MAFLHSISKCNTARLEDFRGGPVAETFPRPVIQQPFNPLDLLVGDGGKIRLLGKIPANQPHAVLHATLLPAPVGIAKVRPRPQDGIDLLVRGILGSVVVGNRAAAVRGHLGQPAGEEGPHLVRGFPGEAVQLHQAARALVQHSQGRGAPA